MGWALLDLSFPSFLTRAAHLPTSGDRCRPLAIFSFDDEIHSSRTTQTGFRRTSPWEIESDHGERFLFPFWRSSLQAGALQLPKRRRLTSLESKAENPAPMRGVHSVDDPESGLLCFCLRRHGTLSRKPEPLPYPLPSGGEDTKIAPSERQRHTAGG